MAVQISRALPAVVERGANVKTVLQSLASVVGGEAAVRLANFAAVLVIARAYGKVALGAYAVSLAVVTVVIMFSDSGLQTAAITQIAPASSDRNQIVGRFTISKSILLAVAAILLAIVASFSGQSTFFLVIGFWVTLRALLQSFSQLQMSVLKSVSLAKWIGIIQLIHGAFLLLGIVLAFRTAWSFVALLVWMTACQLLEVLLGTLALFRQGIWPSWPHRLDFLSLLRMAAPFGIAYGLANLIVRSDTIVLSTLVPLEELGAFSAVNAILLIVYVCGWLFSSVLLAEVTRISAHPESLKAYANQWARVLLFSTVPCALLVSLIAPKVVVFLYGPAFASSGRFGSVMALACPLILMNSVYTTVTIAAGHRAVLMAIFSTGAAATIALDFLLGRGFGALGVCIAIVIREAAMLLGFLLAASRLALPVASVEIPVSPGGN
jgi:O-antigen/teichoic acid export membrane protein